MKPLLRVRKLGEDSTFTPPRYMSAGASGMDVCAALVEPLTLSPSQRALIPTGFSLEIPEGYEVQVRPRSGLAIKHGITCLNSPGTIDHDFRGEVKVILINLGQEPFTIHPGDRIAQMIVQRTERAELVIVDELSVTERGIGGFGSTG